MDRTDSFVMYTNADRTWAEWMAWHVSTERYPVVVLAWDFGPSRDWAHRVQRATTTAARAGGSVVGRLPRFGAWGGGVGGLLRTGPGGEQRLLLPVRVGPVEPPELLQPRVYVGLVGRNAAAARTPHLAAERCICSIHALIRRGVSDGLDGRFTMRPRPCLLRGET
jgi:hypothetical protein